MIKRIADVNRIPANELVINKAKLVLTKTESQKANLVWLVYMTHGLNYSWLAVISTLKVQFTGMQGCYFWSIFTTAWWIVLVHGVE